MNETTTNKLRRICFVRTGGSGDAGAFKRALRISSRCGAELNIVSVVAESPPALLRLLASWSAGPESFEGEAEQSDEMDKMVKSASRRNVAARGDILRGPVFSEVIRKVLRDEADLLIKAAGPSSGIQRVLFGYTDLGPTRDSSLALELGEQGPQAGLQDIWFGISLGRVNHLPFVREAYAMRTIRHPSAVPSAHGRPGLLKWKHAEPLVSPASAARRFRWK